MNSKFMTNLCGLVQLGAIVGLTAIGLKRNNDCYKAEVKLVDVEIELIKAKIENEIKGNEIKRLKKELAELKNEEVEES